jgi:predicted kinase
MKAFILIGAPGSGKTSQTKKISEAENVVVVEYDDIRAQLWGSAEIQGPWAEIQDRIEECIADAAEAGHSVCLDGTHYLSEFRKEAVVLLQSYGYQEIEAIVMDSSLEVCLKRNSERSRKVPEFVIKEMHEKLQKSLRGIYDEGFTRIEFVY